MITAMKGQKDLTEGIEKISKETGISDLHKIIDFFKTKDQEHANLMIQVHKESTRLD